MSEIPLILFAKAPIAGLVKTRLASHCSEIQCAEIAQILLETSVQKAIVYWPGRVVLSVFLDQNHPFLQGLVERYSVKLSMQVEGDLGVKMAASLDEHGYPAAVMGCDVPQLNLKVLEHAHAALKRGEEVIGPAQDGGFYLLGVNQNSELLLAQQAWGGEQVLSTTLSLAKQQQRQFHCLESLRDIDTWADLLAASHHVPAIKEYLSTHSLI